MRSVVCFLLTLILSLQPLAVSVVQAQGADIDIEIPQLQLVSAGETTSTGARTFVASASDDSGVARVTLFYRLDNADKYRERPMRGTGAPSLYATTLRVPPETYLIDYYIKAQDLSGNAVFKGYAFSPLSLQLGDAPADLLADGGSATRSQPGGPSALPTPGLSSQRKWLYAILGVVVVGALAGMSSGGGDGSSSTTNCPPEGCTVTITTQLPVN